MFTNFSLLLFAQKRTSRELSIMIGLLFYQEAIIGFLIMLVMPNSGYAYWIATAHPISRLPVFFMGICAGVLCVRIRDENLEENNLAFGTFSNNCVLSFVEDNFLPIPFASNDSIVKDQDPEQTSKTWRRRLDINMFYYIAVILSMGTWNVIATLAKEKDASDRDASFFEESWLGPERAYLQFSMVHTQLMIILGLCWDNKKSLTSKFFNSKVMQFFGRISMSLYLIHEPVVFYIRFFMHGVWNWEDAEGMEGPPPSPIWTVPIHVILSLCFGTLITIYIEEPARKILKEYRDHLINKRNEALSEKSQLVPKTN